MNAGKKLLTGAMLFAAMLVLASAAFAATASDGSANSGMDVNSAKLTSDALLAYNKIIANQAQLADMNQRGIGTTRVSDEIFIAQQLFENAYQKQQEGAFADFSKSLAQSNQTADLIQNAFLMKDELTALREEIDAQKNQIDTNQVEDLYAKALQEFSDQRFERVIENIDAAYSKISELQSAQAKSQAMFTAAQRNVEGFVTGNWPELAAIILIPAGIYLVFRKRIRLFMLHRRFDTNELEIDVLKNEVRGTQTQYFVKGKMAEGVYQIRTKIYSEKIRDLNRRNALISEQISELAGIEAKPAKKFAFREKKKK